MVVMNKRILLIKGESRYNVLRKTADLVAVGFNNKGYYVDVLDMTDSSQEERALRLLILHEELDTYDFVFSMQAIYYDVNHNDVPIISYDKTKWFGWIVDDIIYHASRVRGNVYEHTYMFTVDNSLSRLVKEMYPSVKNIKTLFTGGFTFDDDSIEKDIDILFPGTIGSVLSWECFGDDVMPVEKYFAEEALKVLAKRPELSVRRALEIVLNQNGEAMNAELLKELNRVIYYVENHTRYICRYRMLEAILKAGYVVHIIGDGFDSFIEKYTDQVVMLGSKDIDEYVKLVARSKVMINPFPPVFEEGFHERVFTSMLCKAACIMPYYEYSEAFLGDRIEYVDMNNLFGMTDRIEEILGNYDEYYSSKIESNYVYAMENHSFERRGEQIIDFFEGGCLPEWTPY